MTVSKIFFDPAEAKRCHFEFCGPLKTNTGRSYEIAEWLGRGGNGSVFSSIDRGSGEDFAIKFLLTRGTKAAKRFLREISLLGKLESEHVIRIHGEGRVRATEVTAHKRSPITIPFFVMDLAEGNLSEVLTEARAMPQPEAYMGQFRGLAKALADLHAIAIHRDIKPENILVQGDKWLLGDYGLSTFTNREGEDLTGDANNIGPKFWMSPEGHNRRIGRGDDICAASDVYQLAAVFWYVVTGRHPSGNLTREDWCGPEALFEPVHRALMHNRTKRPVDGEAFFEQISSALSS